MNYLITNLNNDQLEGLSKLMFDLAKVAFILALFPSALPEEVVIKLFKIFLGLFWGLVCTYIALVLLRLKSRSL